jgi:integrase
MAVGRTRKTDKHLPRRMYGPKHGAYWFVDRLNKWHNLGADYSDALKRYAGFHETIGNETIGALMTSYEVEVLPKQAPDTIIARKKEFKQLRPVFGHMLPKDLEAHHAWNYFEKLGGTRTARKNISGLSAVMTWARKKGVVRDNPILKVGFPTSKPRDRYVEDDEYVAVRSVASPMVVFAMDIELITATRQKDILSLDRKQVAAGKLKIAQSKTGKKINYPFVGSLEETIEAALKMAPQVRQYVIVNRQGKRYTRDGFQTQWKRGMNKALKLGLITAPFTFHDIRAKSLSDAQDLETARIRAGHSDSKITQKVYRRKPEEATVMDISHLVGKK